MVVNETRLKECLESGNEIESAIVFTVKNGKENSELFLQCLRSEWILISFSSFDFCPRNIEMAPDCEYSTILNWI